MTINFSQYVEGGKLSVSFMSSSTNSSSDERISSEEIRERIEKLTKEELREVARKIKEELNEFLSELINFLQNNTYITELSLTDSFFFTEITKTLAQSSCLQNIRKLDLPWGNIDAEGVKALAQSPHLQNLRELNLSFKDMNVENVKALVQSPYLMNLRKLSINNRDIDCKTIEAIAELRDPRIEFDKLLSNAYQIFYKFLLSKVYFDNQTIDEKDVKEMIMDLVFFPHQGKVIEHILENSDRYPFSINSKDLIFKKTLLGFAVVNRNLKLAEILIREGADVNIACDGRTPLHLAAENGATEIAQALIKAEADIDAVNRTGETPLTTANTAKNTDLCRLIVNYITRLEAAELYIIDQNLQKRNEFVNSSEERRIYFQHFRKCEQEVKEIKERNEPLYDFLRESDVNKMGDIWEENENVRNEFDNERDLKKKYPEYADILINKANKVKKEIFLHNQKPLIHWLQAYYRCDFRAMTFPGICSFFDKRKQDKIFKEYPMRLGSIMGRLDSDRSKYLIDCEKRSCPKLSVQTAKYCIKNKLLEGNLSNPNIELLPAVSQTCSADGQVSPPTSEIIDSIEYMSISDSEHNNDVLQNTKRSKLPVIASSALAIAGIVSGIAIAVYLEMLAVGITVGICCLVFAAITYYCNSPANLLEDSNTEVVMNQGQNYNSR